MEIKAKKRIKTQFKDFMPGAPLWVTRNGNTAELVIKMRVPSWVDVSTHNNAVRIRDGEPLFVRPEDTVMLAEGQFVEK